MCGGGSSGNTTTTQSGPSPEVSAAYQGLVGRSTGVANQPLQQYQGSQIAGFTPDQMQAFGTVQSAQGLWSPYYEQAANYLNSGATPIKPMTFNSQAIDALTNPYTQDVVDKTQAYFNNQNDQRASRTSGQAAMQNAYGGDRETVAQALDLGQEQLTQAPVISGLYSKGYDNAVSQFNALNNAQLQAQTTSGWLQQGAGQNFGNLGKSAQAAAYTDANSLLASGGVQQSLEQARLNMPYQYFQQQQAYPFQTTGWLGNEVLGVGSASGGTSSTTSPGPSTLGQLAGLGTAGVGLYKAFNGSGSGSGSGGSYSLPTSYGNDSYGGQGASGALDIGYGTGDTIDFGSPYHFGGRVGRGMGGPLFGDGSPFPTDPFNKMEFGDAIPDVSVSYVPSGNAGMGHSSFVDSPLKPVTTQTSSGGGRGGIGGIIGPALSIGKLFLQHGGRVGMEDGGNPVAPIVHQAATLVDIPRYTVPTPATMASIRPAENYAPTFDASGYPGPIKAVPNDYVHPAPFSIPLTSGGLLDRAVLNPAPAATVVANSGIDSNQTVSGSVAENPFAFQFFDGGGGARRGGRIGYAYGGQTDDMANYGLQASVPSLGMIPNVAAMSYVPQSAGGQYGSRSTIPQAPVSAPYQGPDPIQSAATMAKDIGWLTGMLKDDSSDSSDTSRYPTRHNTHNSWRGGRMGFADGGYTPGPYDNLPPTSSLPTLDRQDIWYGPSLVARARHYGALGQLPANVRDYIESAPSYSEYDNIPLTPRPDDLAVVQAFEAEGSPQNGRGRDQDLVDALWRKYYREQYNPPRPFMNSMSDAVDWPNGSMRRGGRIGYDDGGGIEGDDALIAPELVSGLPSYTATSGFRPAASDSLLSSGRFSANRGMNYGSESDDVVPVPRAALAQRAILRDRALRAPSRQTFDTVNQRALDDLRSSADNAALQRYNDLPDMPDYVASPAPPQSHWSRALQALVPSAPQFRVGPVDSMRYAGKFGLDRGYGPETDNVLPMPAATAASSGNILNEPWLTRAAAAFTSVGSGEEKTRWPPRWLRRENDDYGGGSDLPSGTQASPAPEAFAPIPLSLTSTLPPHPFDLTSPLPDVASVPSAATTVTRSNPFNLTGPTAASSAPQTKPPKWVTVQTADGPVTYDESLITGSPTAPVVGDTLADLQRKDRLRQQDPYLGLGPSVGLSTSAPTVPRATNAPELIPMAPGASQISLRAPADTQAPQLAPFAPPPASSVVTTPVPGSSLRGIERPAPAMAPRPGMPSADVALPTIARYEADGAAAKLGIDPYYIGTGGANLSQTPDSRMDSHGFPSWEGIMGPQGRSTAAGKYQITESTWKGVVDQHFGGYLDWRVPANQDAVARILYAERGWQPWAPNNSALAAAIGVGSYEPSGSTGSSSAPLSNLGIRDAGIDSGGSGRGPNFSGGLPAFNTPDHEKEKTGFDSPWMGLVAAGLGMMASRNPSALGAIGEGGLAGLGMLKSQKELSNKDIMAEARHQAVLSQAQRYSDLAGFQQDSLANKSLIAANAMAEKQREFDYKQQAGIANATDKAALIQAQTNAAQANAALAQARVENWVSLPAPGPNGNLMQMDRNTGAVRDTGYSMSPKPGAGLSEKDESAIVNKMIIDQGMTPDQALEQLGKLKTALRPGATQQNPIRLNPQAMTPKEFNDAKNKLPIGAWVEVNGAVMQKQ